MPPKLKKSFRPGEAKTLELKITNRGSERQPVRLKLKNVPEDWNVVLDEEDLLLDSGADGVVNLGIRAPEQYEKDKVGMRLLTIPEYEPSEKSEIWILAKLKPTREQRRKHGNGGLLGLGGSTDDEEEDQVDAEPEVDAEPQPETSVIRPGVPDEAPPEPDEVAEFRYAPGITAGGFYHVTHIPVGDGTLLKFKEQVQLMCGLCSARDVCYEGKFNRYMDRETFLKSDHCFLEEGDYE